MDAHVPEQLLREAEAMCQCAHDAGLSLATAESCTGGLLASLLTDLKGLSHVFERGFVVYSKAAKCDLLGIDRALVENCGAVSREVAVAMVNGALRRSEADVAIAITGFAGPAGEDDEEGLVHLACARRGMAVDHREEHFGPIGRDGVRVAATDVALEMMRAATVAN